jgi:hypothetical protein
MVVGASKPCGKKLPAGDRAEVQLDKTMLGGRPKKRAPAQKKGGSQDS